MSNQYDATLKLLFQGAAKAALRELTGVTVERWLNVELPKVQTPRVDLLGETHEGDLIHLEFQSTNDSGMPLRMAEYYLGVYRQLNRFPAQTVIFVGDDRLRMNSRLESPAMWFQYRLIDIRDLDGETLIGSPNVEDNIISVLTRLPSAEEAIKIAVARIAGCQENERAGLLRQLVVVAGLHHLEEIVEREVIKVPVLVDILENKVLGREYKRGLEEGVQQGVQQGIQQGVQQGIQQGVQQGIQQGFHEGELSLLRDQIQSRFGTLPGWADTRLIQSSPGEILLFGRRLFDLSLSLEEVLK